MISHLRSGRFLNIEDVIYLIRDDRARVNRLRTYLSWKEVRKTARKEESSATKGGADVDVEDLEDDLVGKSRMPSVTRVIHQIKTDSLMPSCALN